MILFLFLFYFFSELVQADGVVIRGSVTSLLGPGLIKIDGKMSPSDQVKFDKAQAGGAVFQRGHFRRLAEPMRAMIVSFKGASGARALTA